MLVVAHVDKLKNKLICWIKKLHVIVIEAKSFNQRVFITSDS